MDRFRVLACLAAILVSSPIDGAQAQEVTHKPVNLSFVYPLRTNSTPDVSSSFRLSLLYGRLHSIKGVDLNLGASWLHGDFRGLQLTGLYSQVDGDMKGVGLAFGPTYVKGSVEGAQAAFFPNIVGGSLRGVQYSTLFNFVAGDVQGIQMTSLFNLSDGNAGFLQISGVANAVSGNFKGVQVGGLNYTRATHSGVQLGLANMGENVSGLQAGIINFAGLSEGLQIGAINLDRNNDGVPIGLVNYSRESGSTDWITFASNLSLINTGVRTTVNQYYSMLTLGYNDVEADVSDTAFLTWNFGYQVPLNPRWGLGWDLGYSHIMPKKSSDPEINDSLHFAIQARFLAEFRPQPKLGFFAAAGISNLYNEYSSTAKGTIEPLFVLGVSAF